MKKKPRSSTEAVKKLARGIKRKAHKHLSSEEKIRFVLARLQGEEIIAALCHREGIADRLYYSWSKEFLEAGKTAWQETKHARRHPPKSRNCVRNLPP